jgi:hypothetical protein
MRSMLLGFVAALALAACAGPSPSLSASALASAFASASPASALASPSASPSQSSTGVIETAEQAAVVAERLTTIAGPWTIGDVEHGTYKRLWQGSTNDLSGQGTAVQARKAAMVVWRVELIGPTGQEQLYVDEATGQLLDWIIQGS